MIEEKREREEEEKRKREDEEKRMIEEKRMHEEEKHHDHEIPSTMPPNGGAATDAPPSTWEKEGK